MFRPPYLLPSIPRSDLARLAGMTSLGTLIAGTYGILHDQLTYTLCPEYFTKMKFQQFAHANFGLPTRVMVAEVGFLGSWWLGLISTWFLARILVPKLEPRAAWRAATLAFSIMLSSAVASGALAYLLGTRPSAISGFWVTLCTEMEIHDISSFTAVGYLHFGTYFGAIAGGIAAAVYARSTKNTPPIPRS